MKYIDKDGNVTDICIKGIGDITHEYPQLNTTAKELIGAINENTASLADKANKTELNVRDFGAKGGVENSTNDTTAFINCFTQANNTLQNIVIPKGVYYLNSPILCDGTYFVKGKNAKIVCNSDMDSFFIIDKTIDKLHLMENIYTSGIVELALDGNGKCNNTLYIKQGKAINIKGIVCKGGKKYSCIIGSSEGLTWELNINNSEFNATHPSGQGDYSLYMNQGLSDNYFSDCYFINGSLGWAYIKTASTVINNIHGYSYPPELAPSVGFTVYASGTVLNNVICDTPKDIGMSVLGGGCDINNIYAGKYTGVGELVCCQINANNVKINNISSGNDINNSFSNVTAIKLLTQENSAITDFKAYSVGGIQKMNKDINVTGKIPYRFVYDNCTNATTPIKTGNFIFNNNYFYAGSNVTKKILFKNIFSSNIYNVRLFEVTNKRIPDYKVLCETDGFTITFIEDVIETLNIRAMIELI